MSAIHRLSVRSGSTKDVASLICPVSSVEALKASRRALILVHGFANSEMAATSSYEGFVRRIDDLVWPRSLQDVTKIFGFHWPGDSRIPLVNQLTYSLRVPVATAAGIMLGELLRSVPKLCHVTLVAHSLGCRVALKALTVLSSKAADDPWRPERSGPIVDAVHLMAAAVPSSEILSEDVFDLANQKIYVWYSWRDLVLAAAFPAGQLPFGGPRRAVGSQGEPVDRWTGRAYTGLGHGEYWPKADVVKNVPTALGLTVRHDLPERALPEFGPYLYDVQSRILEAR
jgi:hypothetical protein